MILVMCLVKYSTKSDVSAKYKRGCVQRKSHESGTIYLGAVGTSQLLGREG